MTMLTQEQIDRVRKATTEYDAVGNYIIFRQLPDLLDMASKLLQAREVVHSSTLDVIARFYEIRTIIDGEG